jgi:hypothetical protein
MTAATNPIQHSFEIAAERCEDLTPPVYRRLFFEHPETKAMFRSEGRREPKRTSAADQPFGTQFPRWANSEIFNKFGPTFRRGQEVCHA